MWERTPENPKRGREETTPRARRRESSGYLARHARVWEIKPERTVWGGTTARDCAIRSGNRARGRCARILRFYHVE